MKEKKFEKPSMLVSFFLMWYPYDKINWKKIEKRYGKKATVELKTLNLYYPGF